MTTTDSEKRDRGELRVFGSAGEALAWLEKLQNAGLESWRVEMRAESPYYHLTARRIWKSLGDSAWGPRLKNSRGKTLIEAIAWLRYGIEDVHVHLRIRAQEDGDNVPERAKLIAEVNALNDEFNSLADEQYTMSENGRFDIGRASEIAMRQKAIFTRIAQIGLEAALCSTPTQQTS